jgi:penicillin-binding protein 2
MLKRLFLVMGLLFGSVVFLPLTAQAEGNNIGRAAMRLESCSSRKLSTKAKRACAVKAEAAARRRVEAARRRAEEARRRAIAFEMGLRKQAADNIANDKTEGEDPKVRAIAITALGTHAGTVVVMEPKTGKILTIVNQKMAIQGDFEPCSTIKLLTTVAGLQEETIDEDEAGQDDLEHALANSKNGYFQKEGMKFGLPKLLVTAKTLGLGRPTGINSPGENPGKLPLVQKSAKVFSHGYGFKITALQQAVMTSIIANHGLKVTPYIPNGTGIGVEKTEQVNIPVKDLDGVIPGMKGSADYGTAHRGGVDSTLGIAGKTGTCQATGTFTSFGPINDPKYTVVVIVRGAAGKGRVAAGIAGKVYQGLLPTIVIPPAFLPGDEEDLELK